MTDAAIEQQAVPDPATTRWVPVGPGMAGIPTPVVNGQWIKGIGGAAVWSAIADTDVPSLVNGQRLGQIGYALTDCNQANINGWYWMNPNAANSPAGSDYASLFTVALNNTSNLRQLCYAYGTDSVWMRRNQGGTWGPWRREGFVAAFIDSNGVVTGDRGVGCTKVQAGVFSITFPQMSYPVVVATPSAGSVAVAFGLYDGRSGTLYATSGGGYVDSGINFTVHDAY